MKNSKFLIFILIIALSSFLLALKKGDLIELSNTLNARSSMNFYKNARNIEAVLEKGTKGEILETIKLPSGNYGVKTKITNGDQKDEIFWLYYNVEKPAMKLQTKKAEETKDLKLAASLTTTEKQTVIKDQTLAESISLVGKVSQVNKKVMAKEADCTPTPIPQKREGIDSLATISASEYNEEMLTPPLKQINELPLLTGGCQTRPKEKGWDYCYKIRPDGSQTIDSFQIQNKGPNDIVRSQPDQYYVNRNFQFEFEDLARSDMRLYVVDAPDEYTSNGTYNLYMFFPRTFLPSIKREGDELHVTLPTGEKVIYDAETRKIKGGVLSEKPMEQLPARPGCNTAEKACGRKAKADPINYSGSGVVIKVSASGDLPIGDRENSAGQSIKNPLIATVLKKGKTCKIPVAELWQTNASQGKNTTFDPKYSTDAAFDILLKKKCGYSMFD